MADVPPNEKPPVVKDPVTSSSMSLSILVASLLLMLTLIWAVYDETYSMRPWKGYQKDFVSLYQQFLQTKTPEQAGLEQQVRESREFQDLESEFEAAETAVAPQVEEIDSELNQEINPKIALMNAAFQAARGEIGALVYQQEVAAKDGNESAAESIRERIEQLRGQVLPVATPAMNGTPAEETEYVYTDLEAELDRLQARKAELQNRRVEILQEATDLRRKRDSYLQENLVGLNEAQMEGLQREAGSLQVGIRQIHVVEMDLVDRCESCHLATRAPLEVAAADMGGRMEFASHPRKQLLDAHDPEQFGCSPCHNGNGRATTSVVKGHGRHEFWLWPLWEKENIEAGCQQCHTRDLYLPDATTLNEGKFLYQHRGCVGCHRYEGYDTEGEQLLAVQNEILQNEQLRRTTLMEIDRTVDQADRSETDEQARFLYAKADGLKVSVSGIDGETTQMNGQVRHLMKERKKVGPSLKEVHVKLNKNWIPEWIENPQAFRPATKMPQFRLDEQQVRSISAFIWQSGVRGDLPSHPRGNASNGKELFETRGCMACHSVGEGGDAVGGEFAANLSRVGEKANYEYLVRWVHNPRVRTAPYCPFEKRDLTPEDYENHGLPYVFDLDHSTCPNDEHELQVQQMTVMPSLRLSTAEARDIASYLMTLKQREPGDYEEASYIDDTALFEEGKELVRHFGCVGCHEIAGLEEESRIGTELTREGSKPIERLDFSLMTHDAEREDWYNHKGFFERKLKTPAIYDEGKIKGPLEKLRMPNFHLEDDEITALTTLLLGSVESPLPERYFYHPEDQRQAIQQGWEVILKYNCTGCHSVRIGQRSTLSGLPLYQSPDWREQLPPSIIGEGARVDPLWLAGFLSNPALSETSVNRNGVRPYLQARMPTFYFSQGEVLKLVRFFEAMSSQPQPYIAPELEPLRGQELSLARQLFRSEGAPCLSCHATGDPAHDARATAPSFLLSKVRLKPDWSGRWMLDPSYISPGTAMPSGLFRRDGERWISAGPTPPDFNRYDGDHLDLLVRYIFQFTEAEQR